MPVFPSGIAQQKALRLDAGGLGLKRYMYRYASSGFAEAGNQGRGGLRCFGTGPEDPILTAHTNLPPLRDHDAAHNAAIFRKADGFHGYLIGVGIKR